MNLDGMVRERGATPERTKKGQFVEGNSGGPGRGITRAVAQAKDKYRRETAIETARALADDIPTLEKELADLDDAIAVAERTFLGSLAPMLGQRAKVDMILSRARVALTYVANPRAFGDCSRPTAASRRTENARQIAEVEESLVAAERELARCPAPQGDAAACIGDSVLWKQSQRHREADIRVLELKNEIVKLERYRDTVLAL
jgi:hypothetical protein